MNTIHRNQKIPRADAIADMADNGENISKYFTNKFEVKSPLKKTEIQRKFNELSEPQIMPLKGYLGDNGNGINT